MIAKRQQKKYCKQGIYTPADFHTLKLDNNVNKNERTCVKAVRVPRKKNLNSIGPEKHRLPTVNIPPQPLSLRWVKWATNRSAVLTQFGPIGRSRAPGSLGATGPKTLNYWLFHGCWRLFTEHFSPVRLARQVIPCDPWSLYSLR